MTAWDEFRSGLSNVARLNPMVATQEAIGEVAGTTQDIVDDIGTRGRENRHAVEQAKGELAQAKASGASTSDQLLTPGREGLRFFDAFLPLYTQWTGSDLDLDKDVYSRYHELYGIEFAAFRRDAAALHGTYGTLRDTYAEIDSEFRSLVSTWSGQAATAATGHMSALLEAGHAFQEGMNTFRRNLEHHTGAMETLVRLCAESALELYSFDCGGHTPPAVEKMIAAARNQSGVTLNDTVGAIMDSAGGLVKSAAEMIPNYGGNIAASLDAMQQANDMAKKILNNEFVPAFESKLRIFNEDICRKTQDDLHNLWDEFNNASDCVPRNPFADAPPLFST